MSSLVTDKGEGTLGAKWKFAHTRSQCSRVPRYNLRQLPKLKPIAPTARLSRSSRLRWPSLSSLLPPLSSLSSL